MAPSTLYLVLSILFLAPMTTFAQPTIPGANECYAGFYGFGATQAEANNAASNPLVVAAHSRFCDDGNVCPDNQPLCVFPGAPFTTTTRRAFNGGFETFQTCAGVARLQCVPAATANGDPHLVGFDGRRFDFHGLPGRRFLLFARRDGDVIAAGIRGITAVQNGAMKQVTYFDQVGVQMARSSARVHVAMALCPTSNTYKLVHHISGSEAEKTVVKLRQLTETKVEIQTQESKVIVKLMWADSHKAHLNLIVNMLRKVMVGDEFTGVLGLTLNKAMGLPTDKHFNADTPVAVREASFVQRFMVNDIFPQPNF